MVQHTFALILALNHHLQDYGRRLRAGAWQDSAQFCVLEFPIRELAGRRLGVVGLGELGGSVARVADAFGMEVMVAALADRPERPDRVPLARSNLICNSENSSILRNR